MCGLASGVRRAQKRVAREGATHEIKLTLGSWDISLLLSSVLCVCGGGGHLAAVVGGWLLVDVGGEGV